MGKVKDAFLNKEAMPMMADVCTYESAKAPEGQADTGDMTVEQMQKILIHHQNCNRTTTRNKYINYWKEQIAYKILLEEVQDGK